MALLDSDRLLENLEREFADDRQRRRPALSPIAVLLATASFGAAAVHFGYAPAHFDEYWAYGAFFVAVAWFQVAWGATLLLRPSRGVLVTGAVVNAAVVGVWILSRTAGVLVGPQSGTSEAVGFPDLLATAFEVFVIVGAMAALLSPRFLRAGFERVAVIGVVAAVVLAAAGGAAYALTPRFSAGHTHSHATASGAGHTHTPTNASGTGTLGTGVGQAHNHDQLAEQAPYIVPTPAERATLAQQLTDARAIALRYPTVADASRAGMILAGGFAAGSGAHYISISGSTRGINPDGSVNASNPGSLIYDGTSPTSKVIGVMYTSLGAGAAPAGFAGLNDHWHRHANVCTKYGGGMIQVPFPADSDITRAMCDAVGGNFMKQTIWMVHAWVVPGWESPLGIFSHDNPIVRCADGTTNTDNIGMCQGT